MRECACGFSCGTDAAFARHIKVCSRARPQAEAGVPLSTPPAATTALRPEAAQAQEPSPLTAETAARVTPNSRELQRQRERNAKRDAMVEAKANTEAEDADGGQQAAGRWQHRRQREAEKAQSAPGLHKQLAERDAMIARLAEWNAKLQKQLAERDATIARLRRTANLPRDPDGGACHSTCPSPGADAGARHSPDPRHSPAAVHSTDSSPVHFSATRCEL